MPKMTKRKLQAIETKNRIYETALKLMEKEGFKNMTIEKISTIAGVSVGAFYHYFSTKNDILHEIFNRADDFFEENVVGHLSGETAINRIIRYFDYFAQFYIANGVDTIKEIFNTQSKRFLDKDRLVITLLRDIVAEGLEKGELAQDISVDEATDFLFTAARGLAYNWCLHNGDYPLETAMHTYMLRVIRGLMP